MRARPSAPRSFSAAKSSLFLLLRFDRPVRSTGARIEAGGCSAAAARLQPVAARQMEYRILGELEVEHDGRAVELGGPRQRALLVNLLLHASEVVSADRLI